MNDSDGITHRSLRAARPKLAGVCDDDGTDVAFAEITKLKPVEVEERNFMVVSFPPRLHGFAEKAHLSWTKTELRLWLYIYVASRCSWLSDVETNKLRGGLETSSSTLITFLFFPNLFLFENKFKKILKPLNRNNTSKTLKNRKKFEMVWEMRNPNTTFGAREKTFRTMQKLD